MIVERPEKIYGKPVKRGKHLLVRVTCIHCGLPHDLHEGLRVPPCNSQDAEFLVVPQPIVTDRTVGMLAIKVTGRSVLRTTLGTADEKSNQLLAF